MKRFIIPVICLLLICSPVFAGGRGGVRIGMDWGYGLDIYRYWNIIYLDSEVGYVVPDNDFAFSARPYAFFTLSAGFEPFEWMGVSFFSGITGVSESRSLIPLGIQASFLPRGTSLAGPLFTVGGGAALNTDFSYSKSAFGLLGAGWRFRLNDDWDMDLLLRTRFFRDSPPIWDAENRNYVEENLIRKNLTLCGSLELGIAISF